MPAPVLEGTVAEIHFTDGAIFTASEHEHAAENGEPVSLWIRARGAFQQAFDHGPEIEIRVPITSVTFIEKVGS